MFSYLNSQLGNYSNIISLLSILISVIALVISSLAFKKSNEKARLVLKYNVYDTQEYFNNKYYEDGNGEIVFTEEFNAVESFYGESWGMVTSCRPGAEVNIRVENRGIVPAKNPVMNFKFVNMAMDFKEYGYWRGISHNHGLGTWNEIRWEPKDNTVVHLGIPIKMNNFCFNRSFVKKNDAFIEVILSAENMKTKKFKIPVKIKGIKKR